MSSGNFYNQKDGLVFGPPNSACFVEIYIPRVDERYVIICIYIYIYIYIYVYKQTIHLQ